MLLVYFPHGQLLQRHLAQDQLFSTRPNLQPHIELGGVKSGSYPGVFTIRRLLDGAAEQRGRHLGIAERRRVLPSLIG
jgi:hypothetical protein